MAASIESPLPPMEERINGTSKISPEKPVYHRRNAARQKVDAGSAGCVPALARRKIRLIAGRQILMIDRSPR